jgi:hypothetical protein
MDYRSLTIPDKGGTNGTNSSAGNQAASQASQREPQRAQACSDEKVTKERACLALFALAANAVAVLHF